MVEVYDRRRSAANRAFLLLSMILVGAVLVGAVPAAAAATPADLARQAQQRFEILPLREGVLLKPHRSSHYAVVEITDSGVAVDGEELSGKALRRRLGEDTDLVAAIAELDAAERRAFLDESRGSAPPAPSSPSGGSGLPTPPPAPAPPVPPEAGAPEAPRSMHRGSDAKVSLGSNAHVARGETSDDVVVIGGTIDIEGEVHGDAVAVGGSVSVDGKVTGDVVAVGGGVELGPNADVHGKVTSVGGHVERDPAARVGGGTSEVAMGRLLSLGQIGRLGRHRQGGIEFEPFHRVAGLFSSVLRVILLGLFTCLAVLLGRRPLEVMAARVGEEPWRCGLVGLAAQILVVPLFFVTLIILLVSVIGIPLIVLLPFALLALIVGAFLGYAAVALRLGSWAEGRFGWRLGSPYLTALVGVLLVQSASLAGRALDWGFFPLSFFVGLLLFAAFVVQYAVWTVGLGAVLITRFGTYAVWRGWRWHRPEALTASPGDGTLTAAPPPVPPTAPAADPIAAEPKPESEPEPEPEPEDTRPGS